MDFYGHGYGSYYGGWHYGGAEKSRYSKNREDTAKEKFNKQKGKMEAAMIENTVLELRDPKSEAAIKSIPTVLMNNILTFVFGKKYEGLEAEAESEDGKAQVVELAKSARAGRRARKKVNYSELNIDNCGNDNKKVSKTEVESGVDFNDMSLYQPGSKITLELTKPNFHLTQPCCEYTDFFVRIAQSVKKTDNFVYTNLQQSATFESMSRRIQVGICSV